MRVTLVNRLAAIHRGGGEIYDLCLARALRSLDVDVEIIAGGPAFGEIPRPVEETPARYARTLFLRSFAHRLGRAGWRLLDLDLKLFERAAFRLIAASSPKPDVVHITGLPRLAVRLESELGLESLVLFPGPPSMVHREVIGRCRHVAAVGAVTPYMRERFRNDIHDVTAGVDATLFSPQGSDARARLGIAPSDLLVVFAGRLVPLKNLPLLVETFAEIRRCTGTARLLILGDGPMRSDFTKRASRAGLRVSGSGAEIILAGDVPHREMPAFYSAADLVVLTSLDESFSLVALEAMACGRTVLVPRAGYLPRLVEDGVSGRLYPPGDGGALVEMAVDLLRHPETRREIGKSARESALRRHSWEAVARDFIALYQDMTPK